MPININKLSIPRQNYLRIIALNTGDTKEQFFVYGIASVVEGEPQNLMDIQNGNNFVQLIPDPNFFDSIDKGVGIISLEAGESAGLDFEIPLKETQKLIKPYDVAFNSGVLSQGEYVEQTILIETDVFTPPEPKGISPLFVVGGIGTLGVISYYSTRN